LKQAFHYSFKLPLFDDRKILQLDIMLQLLHNCNNFLGLRDIVIAGNYKYKSYGPISTRIA